MAVHAEENEVDGSGKKWETTITTAAATNMGSEAIAFVIGISAAASLLAAALVGLLLEDRPRNNVPLPTSSNQTSLQKDKKNNIIYDESFCKNLVLLKTI